MANSIIKSCFELGELQSEDLVSFCYKGRALDSGKSVMIWQFKPEFTPEPFAHELLELCEQLTGLEHPNVLTLLDYDYDGHQLSVVYECVPEMMTLETYLKTESQWMPKRFWKMTTQLMSVMVKLESENLVAGVISLNGIYVHAGDDIKLARVGLYIRIIQQYFQEFDVIEDCIFFAPELIQDQDYTIKSDIYSFGILTYFLFSKQWPFPFTLHVKDLKKGFLKGMRPFQKKSAYVPDKLGEVISICLATEPSRRFVNFASLVRNYRQNQLAEVFDESANSHVLEDMQRDVLRRRKETIKRFAILGFIVGVLGVAGFSGTMVIKRYVTAIPETKVPQIIGLDEAKAKELLKKSHLKGLVVEVRPNTKFSPGLVFDCKPPAGRVVKQNREVRLFISSGSNPVKMPTLVGVPVEKAQAMLTNLGLSMQISETIYSSRYAQGVVLAQRVSPNALVQPSTNVEVVVSGGFPVQIHVLSSTPEAGSKPLAPNQRLVGIDLHILQEWNTRLITIYSIQNKQREQLYSHTHMAGEHVNLQYKILLNGVLDVFYNEELMVSYKVVDPVVTSANAKSKF